MEGAQHPPQVPASCGPDVNATWVLTLRLCILVAVLFSASWIVSFGSAEEVARLSLLFLPLTFFFAVTGISALYLRKRSPTKLFFTGHISIDGLIITGVIYMTGGAVSPFLFLYIALVMMTAIFMTRTAALIASACCVIVYCSLILLMRYHILISFDGSYAAPLPSGGLVLQLVGLTSALILVAAATSFLVARIRAGYELVSATHQTVRDLNSQNEDMLQNYPDGVIVTELDYAIRSMNGAARSILQIGDLDYKGLSVGGLLKKLDNQLKVPLESDFASPEGTEIELSLENSGITKRLHSIRRPMRDSSGRETGYIHFLHDVTKLRSAEELLEVQERMARLLSEATGSRSAECGSPSDDFVGESNIIKKVFSLIIRVADSEATVLVTGESGTGKELVARGIHNSSKRRDGPFVAVNCGAIPENLIESELFGHKKGAFTGADSDSIGLFRQAQGGTLFLDEIGELPVHMQTKLLRTLQEKKVRPVGATLDIPVEVRIVAATNRNLKREVERGAFREDLFYRLNVVGIQLPALRERREDIPLLVNAILRRLTKTGETQPMVAATAMQLLLDYPYPGNVRELENILERALVLGGDAILPEHLSDSVREHDVKSNTPKPGETSLVEIGDNVTLPLNLDSFLGNIERQYLQAALLEARGIKKQAAELLGMNFRSFRYRLAKYGLGNEEEVRGHEERK